MESVRETVARAWTIVHENPDLLGQIGALAGGVLLVGVLVLRRGWTPELRASVTQDGAYLASRALLTLPLSIALLAGLGHIVSVYAPWLQIGWLPGLPKWQQFLLYVVAMDGLAYAIHRAFHAVPALWHFHAIHHSQQTLNAFTTTRIHVVELLIKRVLMWAPLAVLGEPTETLAWFVALDGFWGFFVHSGLRVPLGPLRYLVVEPGFHLVHHSQRPEHHHANYAERFVIWDLIFGTARFGVPAELPTGIDDPSFPRERSASFSAAIRIWIAQFLYPFRKLSSR